MLASWRLEPSQPDWAEGLRDSWTPGEASARAQLKTFLETGVAGYCGDRDRPDRNGTSKLSPHLRCGEISPRQVWHAARFAASERPPLAGGIDKFLSELGWREFCRHLLFDVPNRVRMVAASFLVKHLLIDWRCGEKWFWDTLVDADAGSNPANWQWVAGSGADAAPYFRIFNPTLQGEKFDPDGVYVRRWVPELTLLPAGLIHQPWMATPLELAGAGVELGKTFPYPIVDRRTGRERALAAYAGIRNASMTSV